MTTILKLFSFEGKVIIITGAAGAIAVRLALVGHQQAVALGREHHHVRAGADLRDANDLTGGGEEDHTARVRLLGGVDGHRDQVLGGHVNAVGAGAIGLQIHAPDQPGRHGVGDVDDIQGDIVGVGDIHPVAAQGDRLA